MDCTIIDCTLRDGGYYNDWDFPIELVNAYLQAMKAAGVDIAELGFRFLSNDGFKGAAAYTTDEYVRSLEIPVGLEVGVMVNGSDLLTDLGFENTLNYLFPEEASQTPIKLVRFACHFHEFERVLPAVDWLTQRGYKVGFNLMQIADRTRDEVVQLARAASDWPIAALYFADSMGSMGPEDTARIIRWLREGWHGPLGIHTHDNMGLALINTLRALAEGVTWVDATVTGMGRGPGNARTEELVIEVEALRGSKANFVPLMTLIRKHFGPMKAKFGWGTNPFYYLSGKYGIHPTYVQSMLADTRYDEEDILAVIDHLNHNGGKKYSAGTMESARNFYTGKPRGTWSPTALIEGREVLILGTGQGVARHRSALERYIKHAKPLVVALNTQSDVDPDLIDLRVACHPVRLLADAEAHQQLPQPLITPVSMLPEALRNALGTKSLYDFGIGVDDQKFEFHDTYSIIPNSLVLAYALAIATSGRASRILMAGFDGYAPGDPRNEETAYILRTYKRFSGLDITSITNTRHQLPSASVYAREI